MLRLSSSPGNWVHVRNWVHVLIFQGKLVRVPNFLRVPNFGKLVCVPIFLVPIVLASSAYAEEETPWRFVIFGNEPPYHFHDRGGREQGFDVDFAELLEGYISRPSDIQYVSEETFAKMILNEEVDGVIGLRDNQKYQALFDYSKPLLIHKLKLFIMKDRITLEKLTDFKGFKVGIPASMEASEFLQLLPGVQAVSETSIDIGLINLVLGRTDFFLGDEHEVGHYIEKLGFEDVSTIGGVITQKNRYVAVVKGRKDLLNEINRGVESLRRDFGLQDLSDKWLVPRALIKSEDKPYLKIIWAALGAGMFVLLLLLVWNRKLTHAVEARSRELMAEHEHYQNIFDHASDGILVVNPGDASIVESNAACEIMLGYSKKNLTGMTLKTLDMAKEPEIESDIQRLAVSNKSMLFEARWKSQSGEAVDVLIHARSFPYKGQRMVEAIVRDITERKKIQRLKDNILQDVAHELKTPISKVGMSLDILTQIISASERQRLEKFFDICTRSIKRLASTVDGILSLSKLEYHAVKPSADDIVIQGLIRMVVDEMSIFAQKKNIQLLHELPEELIHVKGDHEMIRRLFVNLISNAIKFTSKGAVRVIANLDRDFVRISVKDDGIGLEPDDLNQVFSRFFQKSASYEGSGVGLTISEKIVAYHNGVIWAESAGLGKGATMNVLLPLGGDPQKKT